MLVDSPMASSLFAPPFTEYNAQDLNDIFHTELFALPSTSQSSSPASHSQSSGSRESTPSLLTPPQAAPATSFPDIAGEGSPTPSFFNFLDEDVKTLDPLSMLSTAPYDFFGFSSTGGGAGSSMSSEPSLNPADMSNMLAIDPQLVGSPAPMSFSDIDSEATSPSQHATSPEDTTIAPVKVGGHGKARKGTVVGGGIKKSSASSAAAAAAKENAANSFMPSTTFKPKAKNNNDDDEDGDDEDLPADWRPPPEVFQKMTSKEKRQLRNKISARNFRIRRKEYISTLEDNIAERDRLLSAIRSELGSSQSENVALRQEIAALKRTLLENRGPAPVLPPPAPLSPPLSALSPSTSSAGSPSSSLSKDNDLLPSAHMLKDIAGSSSSSATSRFWGGAHGLGMGGYTSVHTARIPELLGTNPFAASPFAAGEPAPVPIQQENLNPALNGGAKVSEVLRAGLGLGAGTGPTTAQGDAFGDSNPFTVRSLDAYRMHLWGRMAAQYRHNKDHATTNASNTASPFSNGSTNANNSNSAFAPSPFFNASAKAHSPPQSPPFPLSGLAGGLRPKYFANPTLPYGYNNSNHSTSSLASSLAGLSLSPKGTAIQRQREQQREKERESQRERETAMAAAVASQTLLKKLGGAFWDAFSGHEGKPSAGPSSSSLDTEKVRKVLEGKAVVRVVDVDPPSPKVSAAAPKQAPVERSVMDKKCASTMVTVLEESMRSLNISKK
ncbi:BZIP domain-containing protein [Favolaschia claudopus]|uniref:BZIP domain-containing protein n=1 Tax=Favolaschia claudopus TaxID=2862362 RepID=A0AAW0E9R9_9AGAR